MVFLFTFSNFHMKSGKYFIIKNRREYLRRRRRRMTILRDPLWIIWMLTPQTSFYPRHVEGVCNQKKKNFTFPSISSGGPHVSVALGNSWYFLIGSLTVCWGIWIKRSMSASLIKRHSACMYNTRLQNIVTE